MTIRYKNKIYWHIILGRTKNISYIDNSTKNSRLASVSYRGREASLLKIAMHNTVGIFKSLHWSCADIFCIDLKFIVPFLPRNPISTRERVTKASLTSLSGADPGILVRGGVDFFFKGMGFGARLKAPSGSRATPRGWSPRKLLNFSNFRSKI